MAHAPTTSFSNRNRVQPTNLNYFRGSPYRQYGSGIGAAIKAGLRGFVIPMVKRYGIPVAKSFLQQAAPEVLNILDGSSKPKTAMKNAVKKTIRQQIGGGRGRTRRKKIAFKKKRKVGKRPGRPSLKKAKKSKRKSRKSAPSRQRKKTFKKKTSKKTVASIHGRSRKKGKKRSRQDFFASIVDRA